MFMPPREVNIIYVGLGNINGTSLDLNTAVSHDKKGGGAGTCGNQNTKPGKVAR